MARLNGPVVDDDGCVFVDDVLRRTADAFFDLPAFVDCSGDVPATLTYGQWDRATDAVAALLAERGVRPGDCVGAIAANSLRYPVLMTAAIRLGAIVSGANPRLGPQETDAITAATDPTVTWVGDGLRHPACCGSTVSDAELDAAMHGAAVPPAVVRSAHDPVAIVWTSGTTGVPKGAVYGHSEMRAVAAVQGDLTRPHDRYLSAIPFAHVGFTTKLWGNLVYATTQVIAPAPWRAADALRIIAEQRVTVTGGMPAQLRLMLDHPDFARTDLSSLRQLIPAGAVIEPSLVHELRARTGCIVVARYTCTEAAITTGTDPDAPDDIVATTVGTPVSGVELRLVDDDGTMVTDGSVGEIRCRSAAMMRGYWRDPDATAETLVPADDGGRPWLATGDLGRIDPADGQLRIVGRRKDMYLRGGYNVYPVEVETRLAAHPAVTAAAVVGVPDRVLGERGAAFVTVTDPTSPPTRDDLRAWVREALADYKAPDHVWVVDAIPLTSLHKPDKVAMRTEAQRRTDDGS